MGIWFRGWLRLASAPLHGSVGLEASVSVLGLGLHELVRRRERPVVGLAVEAGRRRGIALIGRGLKGERAEGFSVGVSPHHFIR